MNIRVYLNIKFIKMLSTPVLHRVNGSPQGEQNCSKGE